MLVWVDAAFFRGWGCDTCCWKDFIPRDVPTLAAPSTEAHQAFKQHKCEKTPHNRGNQLDLGGHAHGTPFHRFQASAHVSKLLDAKNL